MHPAFVLRYSSSFLCTHGSLSHFLCPRLSAISVCFCPLCLSFSLSPFLFSLSLFLFLPFSLSLFLPFCFCFCCLMGFWLLNQLKTRFLITQSLTTALLIGLGDILSQNLVERRGCVTQSAVIQCEKQYYDWNRTGRMFTVGMTVVGPLTYAWFLFLEKRVKFHPPFKVALVKVGLDQTIAAPLFLLMFISSVGFLERKPFHLIQRDLQAGFLDIMRANYFVWPLVQFINFAFVPFSYRIAFVQTIAVGWNTYLSHKVNRL